MTNNTIDLETYEWDSPWWEHMENPTSPRAAIIGDSISNGTRPKLNEISGEKLLFDGFHTSKALDNPFFAASLELFFSQTRRTDMILFNNGLHGWHLDEAGYEKHYREMLEFLLKKEVPVFILLTTFLPSDPDRNTVVRKRNGIALKLAEEYGLKVIDLYNVSEKLPAEQYCGDGVHFRDAGYIALAKEILKEVLS